MTRKQEPIVENDLQGQKRLEDLPDQPQAHLVRGFGAVNPVEGALEGVQGEEGKRRAGEEERRSTEGTGND